MLELLMEFEEGLVVMVMGMGVVFCFLLILVFAMQIMSKVVGKLNEIFPEKLPEQKVSGGTKAPKDDEAIAVAIAMAIKARG